jgi:hypothetical protein
VLSDSDEFKVLKLLQEEKELRHNFHAVIPVLDMLPFGAFQFVVLPRCVHANMQDKYYSNFTDGVTQLPVLGLQQQKMCFITFDACSRLVFLSSYSTLPLAILILSLGPRISARSTDLPPG